MAELEEIGFCSFEKLMADKEWLVPWQEHSKVACLEIKRCLPSIEKEPTKRMARIMELASEMVDDAGIHNEAAVFYAFHKPMKKLQNYQALIARGQDYCQLYLELVRTTARGLGLFLNS